MERRYSSKFFRIYVPQVHDMQTDFCLFARKRLNKHKYRFRYGMCHHDPFLLLLRSRVVSYHFCSFLPLRSLLLQTSLDENAMSKWSSPAYGGKVLMTPTSLSSKRFKLAVPKNAARVHFDIEQEARKQELVVRLNSQVPTHLSMASSSATPVSEQTPW